MNELDVFVSVGGTATDKQEAFVRAVEDRLRSEGLVPHTVGRNTFSSDAPLKTVTELMDKCSGTVVIALERMYFAEGFDKRGGEKQKALSDVKLATPWNQIEAAMAYSHDHPLLMVVEEGLKSEGLLERGYDWYVQWVQLDTASLNSVEFNGVLASWKSKISESHKQKQERKSPSAEIDPTQLTIGQLISGLKPAQLWSILVILGGLIAGSFALGAKLIGGT
ncbi:hypothetical protein [Thiosocius teredinicola]|uniref:hypothetical protein n=1 Tax=Thiosocius teredinicola TaxID=1973002 RepID=UPI000990D838